MFEQLRSRIARLIAPKHRRQTRMYNSARPSRLAGGWAPNSSADQELVTSLTSLRGRARQLVRDASYAKRGKVIVVNNVIGAGIGMQAQVKTTRGELNDPVNDAIEWAFIDWSKAENCHTGGVLHFHDFERAMMGQIFEAGEVFVRKHHRAFGRSKVPLALELIEAERIADETEPGPVDPGNMVRMGVEVDRFYKPVAYWIRERHQGEFRLGISRSDRYERVPADQIWHLKITDRWPQTRGEPWLHAVVRRLQDMDGYSEAEIVAARGAASYVWWIKSSEDPASPIVTANAESGAKEFEVEPGMAKHLAPGEDIVANTPNRPNPAMDPFMRYMLREVAAGIGTSYESLSRDYSQSNYSSSRLALLDDRDLWRYFQAWFIRSFRQPLHCEWLQQAVLARAVGAVSAEAYANDLERYELVRFKPRGWSWIDPSKEVDAYVKAIRNGLTTTADVIARTGDGADLEDVLEGREQELEMMKEKGLEFDTDPNRTASGEEAAPAPVPSPEPAPKPDDKDDDEEEDQSAKDARMLRALGEVVAGAIAAVGGVVADALRSQKPPQLLSTFNNYVESAKAPDVHNHISAPTNIENKTIVDPTPVKIENKIELPAESEKPEKKRKAPATGAG